jgi:hypothetical protein
MQNEQKKMQSRKSNFSEIHIEFRSRLQKSVSYEQLKLNVCLGTKTVTAFSGGLALKKTAVYVLIASNGASKAA